MKTFETMAKELPSKDEIDKMKKMIYRNIETFDTDNRVFKIEFKKHTEIIRRYDEIIA